jgi:aryl-alcohol dehydrogenase-like predicted oxidoreductase
LATALDLGIDFLDTANIYGMGLSETIIGKFIKGDADKFAITTKGAVWGDQETRKRGFNNTATHLSTALDQSLTRLQVDQVALY